ncbi:MAG TPA: glutamate--tRNA ligase [bacterium]|nr:glutamate--tRNA ligase [bacterium]HQL61574.1 glutamate--tRNA ligase [bacterium]
MSQVCVRFAPSPSGFLHVGNVRTALFNYLFARNQGGRFLLRIEDTDEETSTPENERVILETLNWLGLEWDGNMARQSRHRERHLAEANRLLAEGHAYRCRCTPEELELKRHAAEAAGRNRKYDGTCREKNYPDDGTPFCVRLKSPREGETSFHDLIKGDISVRNAEVDDIIIVRTNKSPVYNFAVVVDDHDMEITHVIRGDGHLTNTIPQILLYRALGYTVPECAHLPLVLAPDRKPLAKRRGAKAVLEYKREGYLPDAVVNYMARLGWGYGDQEYFTRQELIEKFSLEGVQAAPAAFDPKKFDWLAGEHIRACDNEKLFRYFSEYLLEFTSYSVNESLFAHLPDWRNSLIESVKERARTLSEMLDKCRFCLVEEVEIEEKAGKRFLTEAIREPIRDVLNFIASSAGEPTEQEWMDCLTAIMEKYQLKMKDMVQPIRVALTGSTVSPPIDRVLILLGKERVRQRLEAAMAGIR